jgi:predicted nucleic acid-binding protein
VTRFVLDASVALRWLLEDTVAPYPAKVRKMLEDGDRAIVPALWHIEMANSLVAAARRGVTTSADADRRLLYIEELLSNSIETQTDGIPIRRAFATARTFGLTAYDATYLDLAQTLKLSLSTLDGRLRAAAQRADVDILS